MKTRDTLHPQSSILHPPSSTLYPRARRAFSFAEVMFAVVILGIGFIMVAAVFPVAIQQTQATGEENLAAELARQASNSLGQMPTTLTNPAYTAGSAANTPASVQTELLFPPTVKNYLLGASPTGPFPPLINGQPEVETVVAPPAIVMPLTGNQWDLIKSNVILPSDPRFAYVMFYKRENNSSAAQLIVLAVTVRNRSTYTTSDITNMGQQVSVTTTLSDLAVNSAKPPYEPLPGQPAAGTPTLICPDTITVPNTNYGEGSYVEIPVGTGVISFPGPAIISRNPIVSPMGRSYSVGRSVNGATTYELNPGGSLELGPGSTGLWGTTAPAASTPSIAPATPITDTAISRLANVYAPATLQPTVAYATLAATADAPAGRITLLSTAPITNMTAPPPPSAAPGAFVIIADDFPYNPNVPSTDYPLPYNLTETVLSGGVYVPVLPVYSVGSLNGRVFRLGAVATKDASGNTLPAGTYNLDPAYGMRPASAPTGTLIPPSYSPDTIPNPDLVNNQGGASFRPPPFGFGCAKVYIIGAGRNNPASLTDYSVSGAAQDIGVFASYFQVR